MGQNPLLEKKTVWRTLAASPKDVGRKRKQRGKGSRAVRWLLCCASRWWLGSISKLSWRCHPGLVSYSPCGKRIFLRVPWTPLEQFCICLEFCELPNNVLPDAANGKHFIVMCIAEQSTSIWRNWVWVGVLSLVTLDSDCWSYPSLPWTSKFIDVVSIPLHVKLKGTLNLSLKSL